MNWYKTSQVQSLNYEEFNSKKLFGPVYHGSSSNNLQKIDQEGFKVFIGKERKENVSNGYFNLSYYDSIPPPVHHLGFGIYFTTSKTIAKDFNYNTTKGLKAYYIENNNIAQINFGAPRTMMKWWIENGYDAELAKQGDEGRIEATKRLTETLKSKYDAVWYKGKGLHRLLDGDQICVYDTSKIYTFDKKTTPKGEIGTKAKRLSDGAKGIITEKKDKQTTLNEIEQWNDGTRKHYMTDIAPVLFQNSNNIYRIRFPKEPLDYHKWYTEQEIELI